MDGNHLSCISKTLAGNDVITIIEKSLDCGDCPFKDACSSQEFTIVRVEHTGRLRIVPLRMLAQARNLQ